VPYATKSASHILCEYVALDELIFSSLGKHFMERSDYYEIVLRKILHFVRGTGLLAEYRIWVCTDQEMVAVQGSRTPHFLPHNVDSSEKKVFSLRNVLGGMQLPCNWGETCIRLPHKVFVVFSVLLFVNAAEISIGTE
jgi:hypothetical protein